MEDALKLSEKEKEEALIHFFRKRKYKEEDPLYS
jgi:hypothetical protein